VELNSLLAKQLKRQRPKDTDGTGTFDVGLSTDSILSKIKYILKTGIEPFDEAVGGLPFGRIIELYGLEACGKTAMCIRALVRAQIGEIYQRDVDKHTGVVTLKQVTKDEVDVATVFIDNEQSIDEDQKTMVDKVELNCILLRCDTVDQIFKITDITIDKMAEKQEEENKKAKEEGRNPITILTIVVADTIAGTSSKQEMVKDWNKEDYQRQPKMMREGFRRISRKVNRHNIMMICTNQVSENFKKTGHQNNNSNIPQAGDYSTFGGRALKYYASTRIFMYQLNENYKISASKFSQGFLIGFYTAKNRVAKPCRSARVVILFEGGLNNLFSILETLIFLKIATYSPSTKRYKFRFSDYGIETKTFAKEPEKGRRKSAGSSLEGDDDAGRVRTNDPELESKGAWPSFYEAHKEDFDKLWAAGKRMLFDDSVQPDLAAEDGDDIDLDEES
jgi:recombination protein RecA